MKSKLYKNRVPSYVNVYNSLYDDIINDVYLNNEFLPNESVLAEKYGVSRNTLRQALAILNEDGLISKSQGKGTLVTKSDRSTDNVKICNPMLNLCLKEIDDATFLYNFNPPTEIARVKLGLNKSEIILACDTIYKSEDKIVGYSFSQIPTKLFDELNVDPTDEESISKLINNTIFESAGRTRFVIKLVYSKEQESEKLELEEGTPLLLMESIYYLSNGEPFARYKFYFVPEYYELRFQM